MRSIKLTCWLSMLVLVALCDACYAARLVLVLALLLICWYRPSQINKVTRNWMALLFFLREGGFLKLLPLSQVVLQALMF